MRHDQAVLLRCLPATVEELCYYTGRSDSSIRRSLDGFLQNEWIVGDEKPNQAVVWHTTETGAFVLKEFVELQLGKKKPIKETEWSLITNATLKRYCNIDAVADWIEEYKEGQWTREKVIEYMNAENIAHFVIGLFCVQILADSVIILDAFLNDHT